MVKMAHQKRHIRTSKKGRRFIAGRCIGGSKMGDMETFSPKGYRNIGGKDYYLSEFLDYDKLGDAADRIAFEKTRGTKAKVIRMSHGVAIYTDR
jgi:hypothetical protein